MGTRMMRVREEDIASIERLCGMGPGLPFSAKIHVLVRRMQGGDDVEAVRRVVREELERIAGGP